MSGPCPCNVDSMRRAATRALTPLIVVLGLASSCGSDSQPSGEHSGDSGAAGVGMTCSVICAASQTVADELGCRAQTQQLCIDNCAGGVAEPCERAFANFGRCYASALSAETCYCEQTDSDLNCEATYKDDEHPTGQAPCAQAALELSDCEATEAPDA